MHLTARRRQIISSRHPLTDIGVLAAALLLTHLVVYVAKYASEYLRFLEVGVIENNLNNQFAVIRGGLSNDPHLN